MLERLNVSAESFAGEDQVKRLRYVDELQQVYSTFAREPDLFLEDTGREGPAGLLLVFKPGSVVCFREKGSIGTAVKVIAPTIMDGQLMYQVQQQRKNLLHAPGKRWVWAASLEASADSSEWEQGWWDVASEEYVELDEDA